MLKTFRALFRLELELKPQSPWVVRGKEVPVYPDRAKPLKRQPLLDHLGNPILPATSFGGVLRATSERILRSFNDTFACLPYNNTESEQAKYCELCLACQLFGATPHASLLRVDDAQSIRLNADMRSHVAIDRLTGGVGYGPFFEEVVLARDGLAKTITIENFALWQVALLGLALKEIHLGYANLGAGTRKGQGRFKIDFKSAEIIYAQSFYGNNTGVISAQPESRHGEDEAVLKDIQAVANWDGSWETYGLARLIVQDAQTKKVEDLFRECVSGAWSERMKDNPQAHAHPTVETNNAQ